MSSLHPRSLAKPTSIGIVLAVAALALFALAPGRGFAQSAPSVPIKQVTLTVGEEVPPAHGNVVGYFSGTLRDGALDYDLSADGGNFTMAHLHMGAKGANGAVVVPLFSNPAGQNAFHVTGTVTVDNLTGPLKGDWNGFVAALGKGEIYANAHTTDSPAGAIRAQLPPTSLPPAPPKTGSGTADGALPASSIAGLLLLALAAGAFALTVRRAK